MQWEIKGAESNIYVLTYVLNSSIFQQPSLISVSNMGLPDPPPDRKHTSQFLISRSHFIQSEERTRETALVLSECLWAVAGFSVLTGNGRQQAKLPDSSAPRNSLHNQTWQAKKEMTGEKGEEKKCARI